MHDLWLYSGDWRVVIPFNYKGHTHTKRRYVRVHEPGSAGVCARRTCAHYTAGETGHTRGHENGHPRWGSAVRCDGGLEPREESLVVLFDEHDVAEYVPGLVQSYTHAAAEAQFLRVGG